MLRARSSVVALAFMGMHASVGWGASSSLRAVKINGSPILPSSNIVVSPGDRVAVEIRIWGWETDQPGSLLRTYQVTIDGRNGYTSGDSGLILPTGWDAPPDIFVCSGDGDCPAEQPDCRINPNPLYDSVCGRPCPCPPEYPVCGGGTCRGTDHDASTLEQFAFIDPARLDFVFHNLNPVPAVATQGSINYVFGALAFERNSGPTDPGPVGAKYAGTLTLDIPSDANGVFTIGTVLGAAPEYQSFVALDPLAPGDFYIPLPLTTDVPLRIEVIGADSVIPTVSTWGLVALCLTLLAGAKVVFAQRAPRTS